MKGKRQEYVATRAWIFDVDGVITNPTEKRVKEIGLIEAIATLLEKGEIITLNTGRSLSWLMDKVIMPIEGAVIHKEQLSNFLAVGEKGGSWGSFEEGVFETHVDGTILVPQTLQDEIKELVSTEFNESMFYDESKLTMISIEMRDGHTLSAFTKSQQRLVKKLHAMLTKPHYQNLHLTIDPTTIATDIQNAHVGKHFGARRIANWFKEKSMRPQQIIAIGDSQSDVEMAEELQDEYEVRFVFVGDPAKLQATALKVKPLFTLNHFDKGTLEYLKKNLG